MSVLSLTFEDVGTLHDDLWLVLDRFTTRCDSYYLANDTGLLPGQMDAEKVRHVLERLLHQWREDVVGLTEGGTTHLPYHFDDQWTRWLEVKAINSDVLSLQPVMSNLAGWAVTPSSYTAGRKRIGSTTPLTMRQRSATGVGVTVDPQTMTRREVVQQIEQSITAAG